MGEITDFMAVPFDYADDGIVAGDPIRCHSPAAAIQRAQALWKTFGHAGAIAFSRTSDFAVGKFAVKQVLRQFGQVPTEYQGKQSSITIEQGDGQSNTASQLGPASSML